MSRASVAEEAARLRSGGASVAVIAERLGRSRSYVAEVLCDPSGDKARARKARLAKRCVDCGAVVTYEATRCSGCASLASRSWSREAIVEALRAWAAVHGGAPSSSEWKDGASDRPSVGTVMARFGSWRAGVVAAGLEPLNREAWSREDCLEAVRAFAGENGGVGPCEWRSAERGVPTGYAARRWFGSWGGMLEAAGVRWEPVRGGARVRWSREAAVAALREFVEREGGAPRTGDYAVCRPFGLGTVQRLFGSPEGAAAAVGVSVRRDRRRKVMT